MNYKLTENQKQICNHLAEEETKSLMPFVKGAEKLNKINVTTDKTPACLVKYKKGKKYEIDITRTDTLSYDDMKNNFKGILEHDILKE